MLTEQQIRGALLEEAIIKVLSNVGFNPVTYDPDATYFSLDSIGMLTFDLDVDWLDQMRDLIRLRNE